MRRVALIFLFCLACGALAWSGVGAGPQTRPSMVAMGTRDLLGDSAVMAGDAATQPVEFVETHGREGFWRVGLDHAGVWWFVSPEGKKEFLNTVTTVQPFQLSGEANGANFVSSDYRGGLGEVGDLHSWAGATVDRVKAMGFKGLGAWCNPVLHQYDIPMTQDLNVWGWIDPDNKRFYSPRWPGMAEAAIANQVGSLKNNRNLVGYFIDNELNWGGGFAAPGDYFDSLEAKDPNRQQVVQVIHNVWPTLEAFNSDWKMSLKSWEQLDGLDALPREPAAAYERLSEAWMTHLGGDYFRLTTTLIRRHDPNHLILGVRFKGLAPREVVRASRGYTDAESINYYVGDAKLDMQMFSMIYEESHQPVIISEYSFHSLDGTSGDKDTVGFAAAVPDQQARADGYRLFTTRLAKVPYIIGADWFQWGDEPPAGRADGEDVNFGVVDIHDKAYPLLAGAIQETTPLLDPTHATSNEVAVQADVWRDSFSSLPVMHVPFLTHPPKLDGSLAGWPAEARVGPMRFSQTIGIERIKPAPPNVYLGWTKQGLYLGLEVFDNHLTVTPPDGWYWTRDHAEFWISTRPVASDQNEYDAYCHQFFFVPDKGGTVGQWHRDGDALTDNLIPDPLIKQVSKILPDRYIVEMMIPAAALHGFDPIGQPAMAFNVHVHDYEKATDAYWSAPKEVATQLRPGTWGTIYMSSAQ